MPRLVYLDAAKQDLLEVAHQLQLNIQNVFVLFVEDQLHQKHRSAELIVQICYPIFVANLLEITSYFFDITMIDLRL